MSESRTVDRRAPTPAPRIERQVAQHYEQTDLERTILDALVASGKDPDRLTPADLAPVDERDRGAFARAFFREVAAGMKEAAGPPPLGIHLLMKRTSSARFPT